MIIFFPQIQINLAYLLQHLFFVFFFAQKKDVCRNIEKDIWMLKTQCVFWADLQEVSDLSLKACQCCLVDGVLCDHKLVLQSCSQFTQIHFSLQAEI